MYGPTTTSDDKILIDEVSQCLTDVIKEYFFEAVLCLRLSIVFY